MSVVALGWIGVIAYFLVTVTLAILGARRSRSVATYAVGSGQLPPAAIGLSLVAQLTSVATFVVNPGLVYAYGVSALLGYGVAAGSGIMLGLVFFSRRFRTHGVGVAALTVPQWIGTRFQSPALRLAFAVLSLALVTFATLIIVALSLVLARLLALPPNTVVIGLTVIVVASVMVGGATAHVWINAVQATIMLVVAVMMIGAGVSLIGGEPGLWARLGAIDPNLLGATNPASPYFRNVFEVFFCNFIVGIAIVCQPHVISKALYVSDDRGMRRYLATAMLCGVVFTGVLVTGLWARLQLPGVWPIDRVVSAWLATVFSPASQVLVTVGLLCAGLSTLEGILLALTATVAADLVPMIAPGTSDRRALISARAVLVVIGAITAWLAIWQIDHPTGGTVAIFAQYGVYLLFSASFLPLACGMFLPKVGSNVVSLAVLAVVVTYVTMSVWKLTTMSNNPAVLATSAILVGGLVIVVGAWRQARAEA